MWDKFNRWCHADPGLMQVAKGIKKQKRVAGCVSLIERELDRLAQAAGKSVCVFSFLSPISILCYINICLYII